MQFHHCITEKDNNDVQASFCCFCGPKIPYIIVEELKLTSINSHIFYLWTTNEETIWIQPESCISYLVNIFSQWRLQGVGQCPANFFLTHTHIHLICKCGPSCLGVFVFVLFRVFFFFPKMVFYFKIVYKPHFGLKKIWKVTDRAFKIEPD